MLDGPDRTWSTLQQISTYNAPLATNHRFSIPELRVGTLDTLMVLSDDLVKVNALLESVVNKIRRQVRPPTLTVTVATLAAVPYVAAMACPPPSTLAVKSRLQSAAHAHIRLHIHKLRYTMLLPSIPPMPNCIQHRFRGGLEFVHHIAAWGDHFTIGCRRWLHCPMMSNRATPALHGTTAGTLAALCDVRSACPCTATFRTMVAMSACA